MGNTETTSKLKELKQDKLNEEVFEDWNISHGKLRDIPVTVFSSVHPPSSRKRPFMDKALQASKVLRHPGILRYLEGGIVANEIIIVCEDAIPLLSHGLENMSLLQIITGLSSIIETLVFLHEKAGVSHNNVCLSSIYVTSEGIWKLWGLQYLCSFGDLTRDYIERIDQYCSQKSIPPDDKSHITPAYQHARDCYSFGKLMEDALAAIIKNWNNKEDILTVNELMKFVNEKALHPEWNQRPVLSSFIELPFFKHDFIKLRNDIINILLLPVERRDELIRSLGNILATYSDEVVASTLASSLLSHSFMLIPSAATHLMPYLLTPKINADDAGIFTSLVFKESVVPLLLQLFVIHDAAIRKVLLSHFHQYAALIPKQQLGEIILPQILLGIRDTDEELIASTLKSLACLVPLLGADAVIGTNRKQIFATAKPKIKPCRGSRSSIIGRRRITTDFPFTSGNKKADRENTLWTGPEETTTTTTTAFDERLGAAPDIPERSSPDGGEMMDEVLFGRTKDARLPDGDCSQEFLSDDHWSDWDEILDPTPPAIFGVLEVKADVVESDLLVNGPDSLLAPASSISLESTNKSSSETDTSILNSSVMRPKSTPEHKRTTSQGLGEEYDIMSLVIEKKPDKERDLFADLTPNLQVRYFNLETLLIEASHKTRRKVPSISGTLAELDFGQVEEGKDWNEEGDWSPSEDVLEEQNLDLQLNTFHAAIPRDLVKEREAQAHRAGAENVLDKNLNF